MNSLGFRDKEWSDDKSYKIAILGDSYMQGAHLAEGTLAPQILEQILGFPVLNAGINNFGTLHEYLVFKKYLARHRPQLVFLFAYPPNDVTDNIERLPRDSLKVWPRAFIDPAGRIAIRFPEVRPSSLEIRTIIKRHFKTLLLLQLLRPTISLDTPLGHTAP